jgi:hypothetical protein
MVLAMVAIGCTTGVLCSILNVVKSVLLGRQTKDDPALAAEIQALREEVRLLRVQQTDMLLAIDNATPTPRLGATAGEVGDRPPLRSRD